MRKLIFIVLAFMILLSGCTTAKPIYNSLSDEDYNQRVRVTGAAYRKRVNPIGITFSIAGAVGGAYAANELGIIKTNTEDGIEVPNEIANYAIGGIVGFGLINTLNYLIGGQGKRKSINDYSGGMDRWAYKFNKDAVVIESKGNSGKLIPYWADEDYEIKEFNDTKEFYDVFPSSDRQDDIFKESIREIKRSEIPELIALDPRNFQVGRAKRAYQDRSSDMGELSLSIGKYGVLGNRIEFESVEMVHSAGDALVHYELFGDNDKGDELFMRAMESPVPSNIMSKFDRFFGNYYRAMPSDGRNTRVVQRRNFMQFMRNRRSISSLSSLSSLYEPYSRLSYPEKSVDFANAAWEITDEKYADGNKMLNALATYFTSSRVRSLGIQANQTNKAVVDKLRSIILSDIRLFNHTITDPASNGDYDTWKSSYFYDAPYISESGERKFLLRAQVRNTSKFTLPVKFVVEADLIKEYKVEIANFDLSWLISKSERTSRIGYRSIDYYVPDLKPRETRDVAILFDFGKGQLRDGYNFILQATSDVYLGGLRQEPSLLEEKVSRRQLNLQRFWLDITSLDLPRAKINTLFGGEYDPEDYVIDLSGYGPEYYKEQYGRNCGCNFEEVDVDKEFWTNDRHYFIVLRNGHEYEYSKNSDGEFTIHDGFLGFGRSAYDTFLEMVKSIEDDCLFFTCGIRD